MSSDLVLGFPPSIRHGFVAAIIFYDWATSRISVGYLQSLDPYYSSARKCAPLSFNGRGTLAAAATLAATALTATESAAKALGADIRGRSGLGSHASGVARAPSVGGSRSQARQPSMDLLRLSRGQEPGLPHPRRKMGLRRQVQGGRCYPA